jgi:hypothetical protein
MNEQANASVIMSEQDIEQKNARETKLCVDAINGMAEVLILFEPTDEDDEERAEYCIDYVDDIT